jgi:hypothetical protein
MNEPACRKLQADSYSIAALTLHLSDEIGLFCRFLRCLVGRYPRAICHRAAGTACHRIDGSLWVRLLFHGNDGAGLSGAFGDP